MSRVFRFHLVPQSSTRAICGRSGRGQGNLHAVRTAAEFRAWPEDWQCARCRALLDKRQAPDTLPAPCGGEG